MTERELIRRLESSPVPPPPEDLAARIVNDIPSEIEVHPELLGDEIGRRRLHRRPMWLAAAAAVTIALGGAVTWELRHERPSIEMVTGEEHQREIFGLMDETEEAPLTGGRLVETDRPTAEGLGLQETVDFDGEGLNRSTSEAEALPVTMPQAPASGKPMPERKGVVTRRIALLDHARIDPPSEGLRGRAQAPATAAVGGVDDNASKLKDDRWERMEYGAEKGRAGEKFQESVVGLETSADEIALYEHAGQLKATVVRDKLADSKTMAEQNLGVASDVSSLVGPGSPQLKKAKGKSVVAQPSTGGSAEPNDQAYGDVFFEHTGVNPFVDAEDDRLSTFGLDVDAGSFTITRQYLKDGRLPPRAAIRVEEFVNAFDYGDVSPRRSDFRLIVEGAPSAFATGDRTYTLRMAVKAREVDAAARPPVVLVFCVDVSGSMNRENRLGLVKKALHELLRSLRRDDHVGLVVYGSSGRVVLKPTTDHDDIRRAIDRLRAGGSTNAEEGLILAYDLLSDGDDDGRIRRVILCSDGVANVGRTGPGAILERIRREAGDGIELTTVGFGMGNYNDVLMEQLADSGDGRYSYVDELSEARRIFVEELTGTLLTLGHDAKAQVEFDPDVVSRWRLLGYENRDIADHLFRDPTVDAGEIGAGHTVTALYEVKLRPEAPRRGRVATLRLRYRPMGETREIELDETFRVSQLARSWEDASPALKLASSVAEFAEILKGAYWAKDGDLGDVLRRMQRLQAGAFEGDGRVAELGAMVARARGLMNE